MPREADRASGSAAGDPKGVGEFTQPAKADRLDGAAQTRGAQSIPGRECPDQAAGGNRREDRKEPQPGADSGRDRGGPRSSRELVAREWASCACSNTGPEI